MDIQQLQVGELADLWWQGGQLVVKEPQFLQLGELTNLRGQRSETLFFEIQAVR